MQPLHCDKPYNLDEAAARRGTPRRKRKDSRTTAYGLWIGNTYLDGFDRISPAFLNSTGLM